MTTLKMRPRTSSHFLFVIVALFSRSIMSNSEANALAQSQSNPNLTPTTQSFSFEPIPMGAPDAILGIASSFQKCDDKQKVNVCVGAYRDNDGKPWVLPSVRAAERKMIDNPTANKEYLGITGDPEFVDLALKFAYGKDAPLDRLAGVQTLSGTGACCVGGEFLSKFLPEGKKIIYVPNPTWGNHLAIFANCGLEVRKYRYYDGATNNLFIEGMLEDLSNAPMNSAVLLHACAHNPTGCDPSPEQWTKISDLCMERNLLVFFDSAYQGFATGDANKDAQPLREFVKNGHAIMLAQSFAKNFGLYGERCGTLSILADDPQHKERVMSQLKLIIRPMYSSPPRHGSSIVKTVLSDPTLTDTYYQDCDHMAKRIADMRASLVVNLKETGSVHDWSHVANQIGMFAYTGMSTDMCDRLTSEYSIFLTRDGRISIAGLNSNNVEYVAKAIHTVTKGKDITS